MKPIDDITSRAIDNAISRRITFIACAFPGEPALKFLAGEASFIPFAGNDTAPTPPGAALYAASTPLGVYLDSVSRAIDIINDPSSPLSKIVISRLIAVTSRRPFTDVANDYFASLPATFRYIAWTPATGLMFGATPELVLDTTAGTPGITTVALAGTRPAHLSGPWDNKNIIEHQYVVDHIRQVFADDPSLAISPATDLPFGPVVHRCTTIRSSLSTHSPADIVARLAPTPAVAGYPVADAVSAIATLERHQRRYYAGTICTDIYGRFRAYANLRCATAAPAPDGGAMLYNIIVGGGITADSDPHSEWDETERKARLLLNAIHGSASTHSATRSVQSIKNSF